MRARTAFLATAALLGGVVAFSASPSASAGNGSGYEIWMTDQNNTVGYSSTAPRGTSGGRLVIYKGSDLDAPVGPVNQPTIIDTAQLFAVGGPNNATGAPVSRPHMLDQSPDGRHVVLSFVASGHVAIFDTATRSPVATFRMSPGAGGAQQAHAAFWTGDGKSIVVANQNGKLLERIDYRKGVFTHNTAATLNLATCTTPSGKPCQTATPVNESDPAYLGPDNRPDNAPICPVMTKRGHALVTLRGGGLFVVDPSTTPMTMAAAFGNQYVGRDGCGGLQFKNDVFLNGGTGSLVTNPEEFSIYRLRDKFPKAPKTQPDNSFDNGPEVMFRDATPHRDAHGMAITAGSHPYLWQFDRLGNTAEIFEARTGNRVGTVDLVGSASADPTPDIVAVSPDGTRIFAALRGPKPQTGAHASAGTTPGLGVVTLSDNGASGSLTHVFPTSFQSPVDGSQESDPHGIEVVLTED